MKFNLTSNEIALFLLLYLLIQLLHKHHKRIRRWIRQGTLLITPALRWLKGRYAQAYHRFLAEADIQERFKKRKTSVEPLFDLIAKVIGATSQQKQLPMQKLVNVRIVLALDTVTVQISMIMNSILGCPSGKSRPTRPRFLRRLHTTQLFIRTFLWRYRQINEGRYDTLFLFLDFWYPLLRDRLAPHARRHYRVSVADLWVTSWMVGHEAK